jgi:hypothetical protein
VMVDPFFCDFVQDVEVYTVILRIINLEIGANVENVEKKLIQTIDKFLKNKDRLKLWIDFVLSSSSVGPKNLDLLSAWMEFLVLTKKVTATSFDEDIKLALINSCLDGLNTPEGGFNNIELVYLWSQLYLMLISTWPIYEKQEKTIISKLTTFLHSLIAYYKYLTPKIKEIILCAINKTIIDLSKYFSGNTTSLIKFLYLVGISLRCGVLKTIPKK